MSKFDIDADGNILSKYLKEQGEEAKPQSVFEQEIPKKTLTCCHCSMHCVQGMMKKRVKTAIIAGVAVGTVLIILLSIYMLFNPKPPGMTITVDNHSYKTGYGSYSGRLPDGTVYGADVDSSFTMPKETIQAAQGSEIKFSSESWKRVELQHSWIRSQDPGNQFFLEKVDDRTFRLPSDIPPGDYILTVVAVYEDTLVAKSNYSHKLQVS